MVNFCPMALFFRGVSLRLLRIVLIGLDRVTAWRKIGYLPNEARGSVEQREEIVVFMNSLHLNANESFISTDRI